MNRGWGEWADSWSRHPVAPDRILPALAVGPDKPRALGYCSMTDFMAQVALHPDDELRVNRTLNEVAVTGRPAHTMYRLWGPEGWVGVESRIERISSDEVFILTRPRRYQATTFDLEVGDGFVRSGDIRLPMRGTDTVRQFQRRARLAGAGLLDRIQDQLQALGRSTDDRLPSTELVPGLSMFVALLAPLVTQLLGQ